MSLLIPPWMQKGRNIFVTVTHLPGWRDESSHYLRLPMTPLQCGGGRVAALLVGGDWIPGSPLVSPDCEELVSTGQDENPSPKPNLVFYDSVLEEMRLPHYITWWREKFRFILHPLWHVWEWYCFLLCLAGAKWLFYFGEGYTLCSGFTSGCVLGATPGSAWGDHKVPKLNLRRLHANLVLFLVEFSLQPSRVSSI